MRNRLRARLASGETCVNGWLAMPGAYGAELMARTGWDSLTIDLQHGVLDYADMVAALRGMAPWPVTPLVRVPSNDAAMVGKALDAGAWGVICPMVNSAAEAREFVAACYYAPRGCRSNGPNRAAAWGEPGAPYQSFANDEVLAIPMIETAQAVAALDEILDVPGVSGVYIGPTDLSLTLGLPPLFDTEIPELMEIYRRVVEATARRGQFAGVHCVTPAWARRMAAMGFRLVTAGSDAVLLSQAAGAALGAFRAPE